MTAVIAVLSTVGYAQTNLGESCGCPPVGSRTQVLMSTLAVPAGDSTTEGNLLASTVLTCDKLYILDKKIWVTPGLTLTIQPGTVIKGREIVPATNAASLIITRGGKINAQGTQSCPIVFTAEADPMDGTYSVANRKKWGGVLLLGRATNNILTAGQPQYVAKGVGFIEGFVSAQSRNLYGADLLGTLGPVETFDDNDNSGIMTYVSIRHGGAVVGANNEINGLTLGSVGRGTTLRYIEVISNEDDGIEFFGGTVDLKYAVSMFCDDDNLDWDQGWNGRVQYFFSLKLAAIGDNGIEADGDDGSSNDLPLSDPVVYNATFIGSSPLEDSGIEAKERTNGDIFNSIFSQFAVGYNMYSARATDVEENWNAGTFNVKCNSFIKNTVHFDVNGAASPTAADFTKFITTDKNDTAASKPGFDPTFAINTVTNAVTDQYDATPNPALATTCTPPADGFFDPAPYRGAFGPGDNWMAGWTYAAFKEMTAILESCAAGCPEDINRDGVINNADFLDLLGKFNSVCPK